MLPEIHFADAKTSPTLYSPRECSERITESVSEGEKGKKIRGE